MTTFTMYLIVMLSPGPSAFTDGPFDTAEQCLEAARTIYESSGANKGVSLCYEEVRT